MNKFILTILSLIAFTNYSFANYEIFKTKTIPFSQSSVVHKTEAFFGKYSDYTKTISQLRSSVISNGVAAALNTLPTNSAKLLTAITSNGGLNALGSLSTGIGINFLYSQLDKLADDQMYILIEAVKLKNGSTVLISKFLICDKNPELSVTVIKTLLK
jgi:hypothetical protein